MRVRIDYGLEHLEIDVPDERLVQVRRQTLPSRLADPVGAIRDALERPVGFPALRQALTPDDHVAVVVDEQVSRRPEFLAPVLDHILNAHVSPEAITVLGPSSLSGQGPALPGGHAEIRAEVHDPQDRRHLSYLATTRGGRRLYLNRTAVDADQLVVVSRRSYDPVLGYSGSEGALYPCLSDEATLKEMLGRLSFLAPGEKPWPVRREAEEVAWLLGTPFMVQLIDGPGDHLAHVVAGLADTSEEGIRLLNASWRVQVDGPADVVVAGISGDGSRHTFADLARALACAAHVVKQSGRIVLLTNALPALGEGAGWMRQAEDPREALKIIHRQLPADSAAVFQWASAAERATIYLLSRLPQEIAEELFTVPLDEASQIQRLLKEAPAQLFLPDAHKMMAQTARANGKSTARMEEP
jgi:nickel-dependent lactate racemase